jgi:hypothetical protein
MADSGDGRSRPRRRRDRGNANRRRLAPQTRVQREQHVLKIRAVDVPVVIEIPLVPCPRPIEPRQQDLKVGAVDLAVEIGVAYQETDYGLTSM